MKTYKGLAASPGISEGALWHYRPQQPQIDMRSIDEAEVSSEQQAFHDARKTVDTHLAAIFERVLAKQGEEEAEIFASHRELLDDEELVGDVTSLINDDKLTATAAVKRYLDDAAETMRQLDDPYLQERAAEFLDLQKNLLLALNNLPLAGLGNVANNSIIVAEDLTPSETAQLDIDDVRGFVLERGGLTSHVAILARNLGLPAVMGLNNIMSAGKDGDKALIDGSTGTFIIDPDQATQRIYVQKHEEQNRRKAEYAKLYGKPAVTKDGVRFPLYSNIGSSANLHLIEENCSEGIGLFRSEFLFMESAQAPSEEEQLAVYQEVVEHMDGKPVILRLLDIGGDKPLNYMDFKAEDNPFLGWRGVRLYKDHPEIFLSQIRAALRASAYGDLRIMVPMVISVDEIRWVKEQCKEQAEKLQSEGFKVNPDIQVGIMIETPASAMIAPQLAKVADFFSIGTNDLTQYTLAVDRGNTRISNLYDSLHPAVLRLMDIACQAAHEAGIEIGICGEMGGQAEATPLLVGMKMDEISISGHGVPAVKYDIMQLEQKACRELLDRAIAAEDSTAVREMIQDFINH